MRSAGGSYPEKQIAIVSFFTGEFQVKGMFIHTKCGNTTVSFTGHCFFANHFLGQLAN
jgi:hypothetical protein